MPVPSMRPCRHPAAATALGSARRQSLPAWTEEKGKIGSWGQNITGMFVPLLDTTYLFSHPLRLNKTFFKKSLPVSCPGAFICRTAL